LASTYLHNNAKYKNLRKHDSHKHFDHKVGQRLCLNMEMDLAASPLGAAGKLKGDDNVSISSQSTEEAIM